ncbi:hypothetical protein [Aestuariimicrobium ganziense]|uniref:hypothetical protein n=1 Tax=Aestuariimicrobium ganziense TaxID=2773677 RepID=UPI001941829F|nr:hypothetical protein [Aestuariimicrobium ganziense]
MTSTPRRGGFRFWWGVLACLAATALGLTLGSQGAQGVRAQAPTSTKIERTRVVVTAPTATRTWVREADGDLIDGWLTSDLFTPGVYDGVVVDAKWPCGWYLVSKDDTREGTSSPTAVVSIGDDVVAVSSRNCLWRKRP